MPIYEFRCHDCNRVFNFFARDSQAAGRQPSCPKCGGRRMSKLFSRFAAVSKGASRAKDETAASDTEGPDELSPEQEARMERAMMSIAKDMDSVDENDPRAMAGVLRRLTDAAGEPLDDATDEAIRRLDAGEDPDKIEEKMADAFPDDGSQGGYGGGPSYDDGLYDM